MPLTSKHFSIRRYTHFRDFSSRFLSCYKWRAFMLVCYYGDQLSCACCAWKTPTGKVCCK